MENKKPTLLDLNSRLLEAWNYESFKVYIERLLEENKTQPDNIRENIIRLFDAAVVLRRKEILEETLDNPKERYKKAQTPADKRDCIEAELKSLQRYKSYLIYEIYERGPEKYPGAGEYDPTYFEQAYELETRRYETPEIIDRYLLDLTARRFARLEQLVEGVAVKRAERYLQNLESTLTALDENYSPKYGNFFKSDNLGDIFKTSLFENGLINNEGYLDKKKITYSQFNFVLEFIGDPSNGFRNGTNAKGKEKTALAALLYGEDLGNRSFEANRPNPHLNRDTPRLARSIIEDLMSREI